MKALAALAAVEEAEACFPTGPLQRQATAARAN